MVVQSLLSGLVFFTSFAMRTPNDDSIVKDDYEVTFGFRNEQMYFKRDWERELGQRYVDDEIWFEWKPKNFYLKPQYVNKTSRDLKYGKADVRYRNGDYSIGYTGLSADKAFESGVSMGVSKKKEINGRLSLEAKWDGYYFRDELTGISRFDMEDYAKINYKINKNLTLTNIFDYNNVKGKKYYKFKIGLEYDFNRN